MAKVGRPSTYNLEVVTELCRRIATSERSIAKICREDNDMPSYSSIWNWLNDPDKQEFMDLYARAKEDQVEFMADHMLEIADDSTGDTTVTENGIVENREFVNRSRLRVDTRKWLLSKLKPKKYGDKLDVTSDGKAINQSVIVPTTDTAKDVDSMEG